MLGNTAEYTFATQAHETHGRLEGAAQEKIKFMADEACMVLWIVQRLLGT